MNVLTNSLKDLLSKEYENEKCLNCSSVSFFKAFTNFLIDVESKTLNLDNNSYLEWMQCRVSCFSKYGPIQTTSQMHARMHNDVKLFYDIKQNGILSPIHVYLDKGRLEIDGYHRLTIASFLNISHISIVI